MNKIYKCPLCAESSQYKLWPLDGMSTSDRVALRLMEVDEVCCSCWTERISAIEHSDLVSLSERLMDNLVGLNEDYEELEKSKDEEVSSLEEEVKELRDTLEDLQEKIRGIL